METITKNLYEAMFLVDSAIAASDWDGVMADIKKILSRADADVESIRKWDERKLVYEIKHISRGTYILCYFRAHGSKISALERDTNLTERIMRVLVLRVDHMTKEDIEKDTPATLAEKQEQQIAENQAQAKAEAEAQPEQQADVEESSDDSQVEESQEDQEEEETKEQPE